ncbi:PKD domain-containing protein, partial [Candidatus Bipolaricaulota bacterium]|nr:PKD domain-containing protein [Candidatus Bipolaricaulota bacterium]
WDFGDGTVAEGMHTEHIFPQQQTEYLVTLTVIDDSGAANASIRMVAVLGCDTCG